MRFTDIDVNFDVRYEGHQNCPKILSMNILRVFSDHHLWRQNWHQYLWTSLCQFNFLWTSSIVKVFEFLTFDIFLTTWHFFDNLTSFWHFDTFNLNHLSPHRAIYYVWIWHRNQKQLMNPCLNFVHLSVWYVFLSVIFVLQYENKF